MPRVGHLASVHVLPENPERKLGPPQRVALNGNGIRCPRPHSHPYVPANACPTKTEPFGLASARASYQQRPLWRRGGAVVVRMAMLLPERLAP